MLQYGTDRLPKFVESECTGTEIPPAADDHQEDGGGLQQIFTHPDLNPVQNIDGDVIIFIAVKFERTRLIDNMMVINNDQDNDER